MDYSHILKLKMFWLDYCCRWYRYFKWTFLNICRHIKASLMIFALKVFLSGIEDPSSTTLLFCKLLTVSTMLMRHYEWKLIFTLALCPSQTHLCEVQTEEVWLIKPRVLCIFKNYFLHLFCLSSWIHYLYLGMFVCSESMRLTGAPN